MLALVPGSADPEHGAALGEHVERRDDLCKQTRVAISHAGHEQPEFDPFSDSSEKAQRGVALEHRIERRPHMLHLEVMVHQREGLRTTLVRCFRGCRQIRPEGLRSSAAIEVGVVEGDLHRRQNYWPTAALATLVRPVRATVLLVWCARCPPLPQSASAGS